MVICGSLFTIMPKTKGLHAIKLTKVKGHATAEMEATGAVRPQDRQGNGAADDTAEEAVDLFGADLVKMGHRLAKRQAQYLSLLRSIHDHLLKAFKVRADLLQAMEKDADQHHPFAKVAPAKDAKRKAKVPLSLPPHRPQSGISPQKLGCRKYMLLQTIFTKKHPMIKHVHHFLRQLVYLPVAAKTASADQPAGQTWLELYTAYKLAGYPNIIH